MKKTICTLVMSVALGAMMISAPIPPALGSFLPVMMVEAAENDDIISADQAIQNAMQDASNAYGYGTANYYNIACNLYQDDDGNPFYRVTFSAWYNGFTYNVDARTGAVDLLCVSTDG